MIFKALQYDLPVKDEDFDKLYPEHIQSLSDIHWTCVEVARKAAKFLVSRPGIKVLDIGSGVGKFCVVGALTTPGKFYGVEYRKNLVKISQKIIADNNISNVTIIQANILDVPFSGYDAFYFFNAFYENLDMRDRIDSKVHHSPTLYKQYRDHMYMELLHAPKSTRIVTYSGLDTEIPDCYKLKDADPISSLKFWIKEEDFHKVYFI